MVKKTIIIRVDGNNSIGSGHIVRNITLANQLKKIGYNIIFVSRNITKKLIQTINKNNHNFIKLEKNDPQILKIENEYDKWLGCSQIHDADDFLEKIINIENIHLIIVDHYGINEIWEKKVKHIAPILVIDDLNNRIHDCSYLLDTTYGKKNDCYKNLVPKKCILMLGSKYALLRDEFNKLRQNAINERIQRINTKNHVKNINISMGGVDAQNVTLKIIKSLNHIKDINFKVTIILGGEYKFLDLLHNEIKNSNFDVEIFQNIDNVAQKFANADICIGASGSTTWERACLGVPTINIVTANNQLEIAKILSAQNYIIDAGFEKNICPKNFGLNVVKPLLINNSKILNLSQKFAKICDGRGTKRVLNTIFPNN